MRSDHNIDIYACDHFEVTRYNHYICDVRGTELALRAWIQANVPPVVKSGGQADELGLLDARLTTDNLLYVAHKQGWEFRKVF